MKHVLVAYTMRPHEGHSLLEAAALFAAEASTGAGVGGAVPWPPFAESCNAVVYEADDDTGNVRIAYHVAVFDRSVQDGRVSMASVTSIVLGHSLGMQRLQSCELRDIFFPVGLTRLFDGPAMNAADLWRALRRPVTGGGLVVGATVQPRIGLLPEQFGQACYDFWQAGDLVLDGVTQRNQTFCPLRERMDEVVKAMRRSIAETGQQKLFAACIAADDPSEVLARGRQVLSQFGPLASNCGFLVDGSLLGAAALSVVRRAFPAQFLHYSAPVSVSEGDASARRSCSAIVHAKIARMMGASGVHLDCSRGGAPTSTEDFAGTLRDLGQDKTTQPVFEQEWLGMKPVAPVLSGGVNALRLPAFFEILGHSSMVVAAGVGAFGHVGGPGAGAVACRQAEAAWRLWKSGAVGDVTLQAAILEFAKTHGELRGAFWSFREDADRLYPGWEQVLAEAEEEERES